MSISAHDILYKTYHEFSDEDRENVSIKELKHLLCFILNLNDTEFILQKREALLTDTHIEQFKQFTEELIQHKPLEYITEQTIFRSHTYKVTPSVLIPRQDTEWVLEFILESINKLSQKNENIIILECGTGSGILSIECALNFPNTTVHAWDISHAAIQIAKENATNLGANQISFHHDDFFNSAASILKKFPHSIPLIISNPPYIETTTIPTLEKSVRYFEPLIALDGGPEGLNFYKKFFDLITNHPSYLICEFGYNQKESIQELANSHCITAIEFYQDLSKQDRYFYIDMFD